VSTTTASTTDTTGAATAGAARGSLVVIASATLLVVLDSTIVNVALPSIQRGLGFSTSGLGWVITSYTLSFGGFLLIGGRSGDVFGRRRMLAAGLTIFSIGGLLGGLAPTSGVLIAARFVQGTGAAISAPTALALITITFPAGPTRNRAMSVYATMASTGGALGLVLGGVLTQWASWRWVFLLVVPIGLAAALGVLAVLPETPPQRQRLDLRGALTATAGIACLVFGLNHAADAGWRTPTTITPLATALLLLAGFVALEHSSRQPLLPGRVLADRFRATAYVIALIAGLCLYGLAFFLMLYLQETLGYDIITAGLAFLPLALGIGATAIGMGRAVTRIGARPGLIGGPLLAAAGALWLATEATSSASYQMLVGPLILLGVGLGATFVPMTLTAMSAVRPDDAGVAAALVSVGQQVGASIGLATLATIAASNQANSPHASATRYQSVFYVTAAILSAGFLLTATQLGPRRAMQTRK
jgi:EmrB/QacA subfamily drug resistance transporter